MNSMEQSFLHSIAENPSDDSYRLIYADWLEEHNQAMRAEFIRIQCRIAEINRILRSNEDCGQSDCALCEERSLLQRRERKLLECLHEWFPSLGGLDTSPAYDLSNCIPHFDPDVDDDTWYPFEFHRGFVKRIEIPSQGWLKHGPAIIEDVPTLQTVRLSDWILAESEAQDDYIWVNSSSGYPRRLEAATLLPSEFLNMFNQRLTTKERAKIVMSECCLLYAHNRQGYRV